jgi:hypothetical protein
MRCNNDGTEDMMGLLVAGTPVLERKSASRSWWQRLMAWLRK